MAHSHPECMIVDRYIKDSFDTHFNSIFFLQLSIYTARNYAHDRIINGLQILNTVDYLILCALKLF